MESIYSNYAIKELEALTGIKAHTIRIWEKRYGILAPERSDTNIRSYSEDELKKLLNISYLNRNGVKISHIAALNDDELSNKVLSLVAEDETNMLGDAGKAFTAATKFKKETLKNIINELISKEGLEETYFRFLYPLAQKARLMWQTSIISRSQADFITSAIEEKIVIEDARLSYGAGEGAATFLVINTDQAERFDSLLFYNYALRKRNFETLFTNYPMPLAEILEIHKVKQFDFVLINMGIKTNPEENVNYLSELGKMLRIKKIFINDPYSQITDQPKGNIIVFRSPEKFIQLVGKG